MYVWGITNLVRGMAAVHTAIRIGVVLRGRITDGVKKRAKSALMNEEVMQA
ncbi:MAG: hypothetical protein J7J46_04175 [Candidatus Desulfofervidus sp.]|nr:hypothetical protein [Candidatus Desulfofervidus sp.]